MTTRIRITVALVAILSLLVLMGLLREKRSRAPIVGDLYSVANSDGTFSVIRVLATRERDFYIRIYGNRFPSRPRNVELDQLSLHLDRDGFTVVSVTRRYFGNWKPDFIKNVGAPTGEDLANSQLWAREASPPPEQP